MVSLLISRIGKAIGSSGSAEEAYARLRRAGYLSRRALRERQAVVATIARATEQYLGASAHLGDELWRHVQPALLERGYISRWGRWWGVRFTWR